MHEHTWNDGKGWSAGPRRAGGTRASGLVILGPLLQRVVCQELLHQGFSAAVATNPDAARAHLQQDRYDFVMLDRHLAEDMTADDFTRQLRFCREAASRRAWVLVLSPGLRISDYHRLRNAGVSSIQAGHLTLGQLDGQLRRMRADTRSFIDAEAYAGPDRRLPWPSEVVGTHWTARRVDDNTLALPPPGRSHGRLPALAATAI